jgi:hypothetical protein
LLILSFFKVKNKEFRRKQRNCKGIWGFLQINFAFFGQKTGAVGLPEPHLFLGLTNQNFTVGIGGLRNTCVAP